MNKKETEVKIKTAFENSTPEIYDEIVADIGEGEAPVFNITQLRPVRHPLRRVIAVAAVLLIVFGLGAANIVGNYAVRGLVSIDVNPSISLKINSHDRIIACIASNDEALEVLDGMDLSGSTLKVGVNALIGSLLTHGYLSDKTNSVLISVIDKLADGTELEGKLSGDVAKLLDDSLGSAAVLSLVVDEDEELEALADKYGISPGRAELIRTLADSDPALKFEDICMLSVNDLNLLLESRRSENSGISAIGSASVGDYIGIEAAEKIALAVFPGAVTVKSEMDYDYERMTYEIEMLYNQVEYEIDVDALSGELLKAEIETMTANLADYAGEYTQIDEKIHISAQEAKAAAFAFLPIPEELTQSTVVITDYEQSVLFYNVEYVYQGLCYDFDIDALSGTVLNWEIEARLTPEITIEKLVEAYNTAAASLS